jgi:hypothetical protein
MTYSYQNNTDKIGTLGSTVKLKIENGVGLV